MVDIYREIKSSSKIPTYKFFVDGEWQESGSKKLINVFSPIDGSLLGRIQSVLPREADIAVTSASLAQSRWASYSWTKRAGILKQVASLLSQYKKPLSEILTQEIGKIKKEAESEIDRAISVINESIKIKEPKSLVIKRGYQVSEVRRCPFGVVLCITPFNYPIYTATSNIVPALLSGNSVVIKPSVQSSISTIFLVQLFKKVGIPPGVLNLVTGFGKDIGEYLAQHNLINIICFTGSTKVGQRLAEIAGMVGLILELGGKDPAIVLEDADLDNAAYEIVKSAFRFAGQRCIALKRVIAQKNIKDKLVEKMQQVILKEFSKVGDPRNPQTQLGPVISDKQADYLEVLLKDALKKGAKIITGGRRFIDVPLNMSFPKRVLEIPRHLIRLKRGQGRYWEATLVDDVDSSMRIAWEEQFGPILPIMTVKNATEALKIANASIYGLDASIFTKNLKIAQGLAEKIEAGQVFVNCQPHLSPDLPFGGTKASGIGVQGFQYSVEALMRVGHITKKEVKGCL